jgi:transaldolase
LANPRWLRAFNAGARPQRLLWASTGTKDPRASDTLYIKALASPFTINTTPEGTLHAFAGMITAKSARSCRRTAAIAKRSWTGSPRPV